MTTLAPEIEIEDEKPKSKREALKDPKYKGEDYNVNQEIENGPIQNRKCTDVLCLLLFIMFLGGYIWINVNAYKHGNVNKLLRPVNDDGKLCGVDELAEYPNLYYLVKASNKEERAVCVKECPYDEKQPIECFGTEQVSQKDCQDPNFYIGYGTSRLLKRFCIPNPDKMDKRFDDKSYDNVIGSFGLDDIQEFAQDIDEGRYAFVVTFVTCLFVTMIYSFLIYSAAGVIVWISVVGAGASILTLALLLQSHVRIVQIKKKLGLGEQKEDHQQEVIQYGVYFLYFVFVCFVCHICCIWKKIQLSIVILKTSAVIIYRNTRVLLIPLFTACFIVLWTGLWFSCFVLLISAGDIKQPTKGSQAKDISFTTGQKQQLFLSVFMFFWIMEFIIWFLRYAYLAAVCTWYFTSTQDTHGSFSLSRGFWWGIRYNCGSLALGTLLLAIIWPLAVIFGFINRKMEKVKDDGTGGIIKCLVSCTACCVDCFHRFIKFINKNGYTMMALTGDSFMSSAIQAFLVLLKNGETLAFTKEIGYVIEVVGRMFVTFVNTGIGYAVITYVPSFKEDIDQPVPFLILIMLMSYKMADAFMGVYDGCSHAVLMSLFTDVDICVQKGKDPMDCANRPKELNLVIGMLIEEAHKQNEKKAQNAEKEKAPLVKK